MQKANNQEMPFTVHMLYASRRSRAFDVVKNFANYRESLEAILNETLLEVLSSKYIGESIGSVSNGKKEEVPNELLDRIKISNELTEKYKANLHKQFPLYSEDFVIIGCFLGNMDYPPKIVSAAESAVSKKYLTEVLNIDNEIAKVKGQILEKNTQSLNDAISSEAGATSQDFVNYMALNGILVNGIINPNVKTTLYLTIDDNGNIELLNSN